MFTASADYYDAVYSWKDYASESARLTAIIDAHNQSNGRRLLDVCCGTGGHIPYLAAKFAIEGLDLDERMLAVARRKHPGIPFHCGDMIEFDLGRRFDVVVSLFSSIGYALTPARMARAIAAMSRHVEPGGLLIVEPFFSPANWKPKTEPPKPLVAEAPGCTVVRMVDWVRHGNAVTSTFHYLIGTVEGVEHLTERHDMGLFTVEETRSAFSTAGLTVTYDEVGLMGRGLFVGVAAGGRQASSQ